MKMCQPEPSPLTQEPSPLTQSPLTHLGLKENEVCIIINLVNQEKRMKQ